jgi:hypothetical protein
MRDAIMIPYPETDGLFIENNVYSVGLWENYNISLYWTGRFEECLEACDYIINSGKASYPLMAQTKKNKVFAINKLKELGKMENTLVIEVPELYDGLGDHLFFSHLPRLAKEKGKWTKILVSNQQTYKGVGTKDIVWEHNPYIDGFTDEPGTTAANDELRNMMQIGQPMYPGRSLMDCIMMAYGLDDGKVDHLPEVYHPILDIPKLNDKIIFDGNWKHYAGMTHERVLEYMADIKVDFQLPPLNPDIHGAHKEKLPFYGLPDVPYIDCPNIETYMDIIKSCKQFYCIMSGGTVLAPAVGKKAYVLTSRHTSDLWRFSNWNYYIYL